MSADATQADSDLAKRLCFGMSDKAIGEAAMLIARHRQSHSLPGDVGMREAVRAAMDKEIARYTGSRRDDDDIRYALNSAKTAVIAALTPSALSDLQRLGQEYDSPSALSGDAGEVPDCEGLGDALAALSSKLLASGFLNDDANHRAYEKVGSEFDALSRQRGKRHG